MKALSLALGLIALASQAAALSCIRPDPMATFQRVAAAEEAYYVLYGQLTFDEAALPQGLLNGSDPMPDPIPARFEGKGLTKQGFTSDFISPVNLQIQCAGPWCGSARSGAEAVYFVLADDPVTFIADPCGGMIFQDPPQATLDALTTCMQGGACSPQPLQ